MKVEYINHFVAWRRGVLSGSLRSLCSDVFCHTNYTK